MEEVKQGNTFGLSAVASDLDGRVDLSTVQIESQIRKANHDLFAQLTVVKANQVTNRGEYTVGATPEQTAAWTLGSYLCDIRYTFPSGSVESTKTFVVKVIPAQTEDVIP